MVAGHQRKSIGHETTFGEDVRDRAEVRQTLLELVEEVARRLRRAGGRAQAVHIKLRTADFETVTRQETLPRPADTTEMIWPAAQRLLARADRTRQAIRLVGVSVSLAEQEPQLELFGSPGEDRHRRVARALDRLADRFGPGVVTRGKRGTGD